LHTTRYLRERILPNIKIGLAKSGRPRSAIELSSSIFVIPSDDPEQAVKHEADVRQQIAFYASTPPYRPVFEVEGWSDVADRLKALAARGQWAAMPSLIDDEMIDRLALRGRWADLPDLMRQKYSGLLDRMSYYSPLVPGENEAGWRATAAALRQ
ncbi:MAG TPA: LLM class flavin-dependent oxidoreductase, partial [Candidatus Binatia bacterium]|nr:LLM class flavin-dependent oxidoreductase [Candidatus Binatia bacterium]